MTNPIFTVERLKDEGKIICTPYDRAYHTLSIERRVQNGIALFTDELERSRHPEIADFPNNVDWTIVDVCSDTNGIREQIYGSDQVAKEKYHMGQYELEACGIIPYREEERYALNAEWRKQIAQLRQNAS